MKLPLLLLALATSTLAAPTTKHHPTPPTPYNYIAQTKASGIATHLAKRTSGGVTLSDGVDFTGDVWYGVLPLAECIALNS